MVIPALAILVTDLGGTPAVADLRVRQTARLVEHLRTAGAAVVVAPLLGDAQAVE